MSEKSPFKDEALEALDFIVNVLKEHEKDLDRLVNELGDVAGQLGETGELNVKVKKIEDKINTIQNEVGNLVKSFSAHPGSVAVVTGAQTAATTEKIRNVQNVPNQLTQAAPAPAVTAQTTQNASYAALGTMPLMFQCSQWEDFQAMSIQAQAVSFKLREPEKIIDVTAIKNNQVIAYTGQPPSHSALLKMWISKQLNISEKQIIEGSIIIK